MKWILLQTIAGKNVMIDISKVDFIAEEKQGDSKKEGSVIIKFSGDAEEYIFQGNFSSIWIAAINNKKR